MPVRARVRQPQRVVVVAPVTSILLPGAYEFSFQGLLFGGDVQPIGVDTVDGLDMPVVRQELTERLTDHGSFAFARYLPERVITFAGQIFGANGTERAGLIDALSTALLPLQEERPLLFKLASGLTKLVYCKPTRSSIQVSKEYAKTVATWAAEFVAGDPRIYAASPSVVDLLPAATTFGIHFPVHFPVHFGGGSSGFTTVANAGNFPTLPAIRIVGPATDPQIENVTTGLKLKVNLTLGPDDHLDIDFVGRTITLNDSASRYFALDPSSDWWQLEAGDNILQMLCGGAGATTLAIVTFASAWSTAS